MRVSMADDKTELRQWLEPWFLRLLDTFDGSHLTYNEAIERLENIGLAQAAAAQPPQAKIPTQPLSCAPDSQSDIVATPASIKVGHYTSVANLESDYKLLNELISDFRTLLVVGDNGAPGTPNTSAWSIQEKLIHLQRVVLLVAVVFQGSDDPSGGLRPWVVRLTETFSDSDLSYEDAVERLNGGAPAQARDVQD